MRFLATGEEMQKIDQISIEQIGIPGLVLMERAALAVTEEIEKRFSRIKTGEHDTGRTARRLPLRSQRSWIRKRPTMCACSRWKA